MRKLSVTILLFAYLAFSCGVVISSHYCMNQLASTQLFSASDKECGICGMHIDDSQGCCRDEVRIVKMDDDQKVPSLFSFENKSPKPLFSTPSVFLVACFQNKTPEADKPCPPPPLLTGQETCVKNCVFRI